MLRIRRSGASGNPKWPVIHKFDPIQPEVRSEKWKNRTKIGDPGAGCVQQKTDF